MLHTRRYYRYKPGAPGDGLPDVLLSGFDPVPSCHSQHHYPFAGASLMTVLADPSEDGACCPVSRS